MIREKEQKLKSNYADLHTVSQGIYIIRLVQEHKQVNNIYYHRHLWMPPTTTQQQTISQQSDPNDPEFPSIPIQASCTQSSNPNILDQAFILYSDDQIQSNSQSLTQDSQSDLSNLSRQSSCSSIVENGEGNGCQSGFLLKSLSSNGNEESSVYNIHESECSESGLELLHQLQPLFKGKVFLRRSPRFAVYGGGANAQLNTLTVNANENLKSSQTSLHIKTTPNSTNLLKKQISESQMVEDDRPTASSRIIEENYQLSQQPPTPTTSMLFPPPIVVGMQPKQQQPSNPFIRFTRSAKKSIHEETELAFQDVGKGSTINIFGDTSKQGMNDSEYVSRVTKEFLLMSRKEKRIKKQQQKQARSSYSLKCLRKRQSSFQRPSN